MGIMHCCSGQEEIEFENKAEYKFDTDVVIKKKQQFAITPKENMYYLPSEDDDNLETLHRSSRSVDNYSNGVAKVILF
jgi:hypothetical protein